MVGKSVNIISGLLVGVFVARYLGPENYGLMSYVVSFVTLYSILATFGLDSIEVRELSKNKIVKENILGTAFILRFVLAFVTILLILGTLLVFESSRFTFWAVLLYSLSLIFSSLNVIRNYFTSIVQNKYVVKTEISRTLIGAGIKIFLLVNKMSLIWFIMAITFDFVLLGSGYIVSYVKKAGSLLKWKFDYSVAKMLLKESFPLLLRRGNHCLSKDRPGDDPEYDRHQGRRSVCGSLSPYGLCYFYSQCNCPDNNFTLVKLHHENIDDYNLKKQQFIDLMVWTAILMALVISLSAHFIILLLYGQKYSGAIPVLQIMAWRAVFVALLASSGQIIMIRTSRNMPCSGTFWVVCHCPAESFANSTDGNYRISHCDHCYHIFYRLFLASFYTSLSIFVQVADLRAIFGLEEDHDIKQSSGIYAA